jgi:DNA polymerase III subunit alpha
MMEEINNNFICNLHTHSDYSLHDGFSTLESLVDRAKELNYASLALTDHGTTTGLISFYNECNKKSIKPILGCECYLTMNPHVKDPNSETYHLLLLAKDFDGYKNLLKIVSYGHQHFYKKPRIDMDILEKLHEGIICTTACIAGPLSSPFSIDILNKLKSIFMQDLYLEIQPHAFQEQIDYNIFIQQLSNDTGIDTIVTLDSHYVKKEDVIPHKMWLQIKEGSEYYSSDDYYLMDTKEIKDKLSYLDKDFLQECINNVSEVVEKCNVTILTGEQNYPVFCDNPEEYVLDKCIKGWGEKNISLYPNEDTYRKQLRYELKTLKDLNYLNYFCIIEDMISWCREHQIPIGLGRGSVVASIVSWLMGITQVDPIKYNLVFERFANPERVTNPDCDTDISHDRRGEVIDYVKNKYGEVYQVRTINYIKEKSAVQRAGQALKLDPQLIIKTSKSISSVDELPEGQWKDLANSFKGHIINYGSHASAVIVSPTDINSWSSVEKQGDLMVVSSDFHQMEEQGLLKLDILGLKTLDILNNTICKSGIHIDLSSIPIDDYETAKMLRNGNTLGCFQIETGPMTNIVKRIQVQSVEELISTVALCRPGPLDSGMVETFLNRRNGKEIVSYQHPLLEPILSNTEGIILYQEQIMQIAQVLCGYTLGEADILRRIIGRKQRDLMEPAINEMISRGVKNGIEENIMKEITANIITFANYGFNRGHSAAYGLTAWVTAYLKTHYPAYFMSSVIDSHAKDKDVFAMYVLHARNMGIKILPPDLYTYTCAVEYNEEGPCIRLGLNCIKGVGNTTFDIDKVKDFYSFMEYNHAKNKTSLVNCIKAGVFKGNRDEMIQYVSWKKDKRKSKGEFKYIPTDYEMAKEETEVLGLSLHDIFSDYDISLANNYSIYAVQILSIKKTKTKSGKQMCFVKARNQKESCKYVCFMNTMNELQENKVYLIKTRGDMIRDFTEAKLKT